MSFELLQTQCLSVFTITIETITFHLTSEDIENGNASFTLPPSVSVMDVCSVTAVIFGGNDVGNSTTADIQFPTRKLCTAPHYLIEREYDTCNCVVFQSAPCLYHPVAQQLSKFFHPLLYTLLPLLPSRLPHTVVFLLLSLQVLISIYPDNSVSDHCIIIAHNQCAVTYSSFPSCSCIGADPTDISYFCYSYSDLLETKRQRYVV